MHAALLIPGGVPQGTTGEFIYARHPLASRLPALRVARVSLLYGEFDWMNWRNGADVKSNLPSTAPHLDVWRVAQATHQQMIDNPLGFADAVLATARQDTLDLPAGVGFGNTYDACARVWVRNVPIPQDSDFITVWTDGA